MKSKNHETVVVEKQSANTWEHFSKAYMLDCYFDEFHGCRLSYVKLDRGSRDTFSANKSAC